MEKISKLQSKLERWRANTPSWVSKARESGRDRVFMNGCWSALGIRKCERYRNRWSLGEWVDQSMLKWFGCVEKMDEKRSKNPEIFREELDEARGTWRRKRDGSTELKRLRSIGLWAVRRVKSERGIGLFGKWFCIEVCWSLKNEAVLRCGFHIT